MFKISQNQLEELRAGGQYAFENEMLSHLKNHAPELYSLRGRSVFREVIRRGVDRAKVYGFTKRGAVKLFIEVMVSYGCSFDSDPQLVWIREALETPRTNDQLMRADVLYQRVVDYAQAAYGQNNVFAIRALDAFTRSALHSRDILRVRGEHSEFFNQYWPEKASFIPNEHWRCLEDEAVQHCHQYDLRPGDGVSMLMALMFSLGHGVCSDPLYPWVHGTFSQRKNSKARLKDISRKSTTYLRTTLVNLNRGPYHA